VPRPGTGAVTRPSNAELQNFLDLKPTGGTPGTLPANRPGQGNLAGGAAGDFLRDGGARPSTLPATRPGTGAINRPGVGNPIVGNRPGNRPGIENPISGRPERIDNRQERHDNRVDRRDEIRDQVRDNHPRLDFWGDHPNWAAWRINRPYRWATWAGIAGWCGGYGWTDPVGYSYGENVYYDEGQVYYGDQPVATAEEYAQQAEDIATSAPEVAPDQQEWMPLGVFALTPDGQKSGPDPTLFLQLAISKQGIISGLLNNSATGTTQEIEGMADKSCQRAAWTVKGKTRPIMETGISNLTQDTAPALVHFADGQTQQWLLVRLEEPAAPK
jgi:hypothetical protein